MPRKTSILIIILAIATGVLIFLALRNEEKQKKAYIQEIPVSTTTIVPFAQLSFSTNILDLSDSKSATTSVDIVLDTKGQMVFGTQLELAFDPSVIQNVALLTKDNSFFGEGANVSMNVIDNTQGRISYVVSFPNHDQEKSGSGSVVTLKFNTKKNPGIEKSNISFLPKTTVTTQRTHSTVLEQSIPLTLILSSSPSAKQNIE